MKKYIITAVIAACLALCTAVWLQTGVAEETPDPIQITAVSAPGSTAKDTVPEAEPILSAEEEKVDIPQAAPLHKDISEPGPVPREVPVITEAHPTPEPEPVPTPEPTPAPVPQQKVTDSQLGDMVYVPGFGWLESQGPNEVICDESIYENGNKIGVMG